MLHLACLNEALMNLHATYYSRAYKRNFRKLSVIDVGPELKSRYRQIAVALNKRSSGKDVPLAYAKEKVVTSMQPTED